MGTQEEAADERELTLWLVDDRSRAPLKLSNTSRRPGPCFVSSCWLRTIGGVRDRPWCRELGMQAWRARPVGWRCSRHHGRTRSPAPPAADRHKPGRGRWWLTATWKLNSYTFGKTRALRVHPNLTYHPQTAAHRLLKCVFGTVSNLLWIRNVLVLSNDSRSNQNYFLKLFGLFIETFQIQ
jgi:hypothetical protein